MKKHIKISVLLNIVLLTSTIILAYKYNLIQKDLIFCEENSKNSVVKNESTSIDRTDPIYIFNSKKFLCDSGSTTYESNLCIEEKLHFADSLLDIVVKSNIKEFDKYINQNKEGILKAKDNSYFINALKTSIAQKENFIKSQKKWEEMRVLNSEYVSIGCDGGTGCSGIVDNEEIKAVLERMQEIKERYN